MKDKRFSALMLYGRFFRRVALMAILSCFAFGAEAATWSTVVSNEKVRIEVDQASMIRQSGIVTAWDREVYPVAEQARQGDFYFKSSKSLVRYGCDVRLAELIMKVYYAEDGSEIKILTAEDYGRPGYVIPDTMEERKFEFVCNNKNTEKSKPAVVATKKKAKPKVPGKADAAKAADDGEKKSVKPVPASRGIPRYLPIRRPS